MIITAKIKMDLLRSNNTPTIDAVQTDSYSRNVEMELWEGTSPFHIPQQANVIIRYKNIDGTGGEYETLPDGSTAWQATKNRLTIALAPQVLTHPGITQVSVSILDHGTQLSTFPLNINVSHIARAPISKSEDCYSATSVVPAPDKAAPGQLLQVKTVNTDGKITATQCIDYSPRAEISQNNNLLQGKKIIYDGDSICESRTGNTANNGGGYAKLIADSVGGTYVNNAVSGAALTSTPEGKTYHSVVDSLTELPTNGDLYCFEGGYNDFCRNVAIGSCENTGYSGDLDTFTICGAMEHIFRYCLNVLVGRPVCFVIVHKCDNSHTANSAGNTFADYRNAMIAVCEKYSIPYYDAYAKSGLNGWNTVQSDAYLTANVNGTGDGTHPNEAGYKRYYVPQLIALFQSMMPTDVVQNAPGEEDAPTDPSEPAVNLIDTVGYTDGVRLSTSTGSEKTTTEAYTTTGFIRMESATEIFQTSGVVFDGDVHAQSIVCVYDSSKSLLIGAYITSNQTDGKTLSLTYCRLTKDGNGNLTIKPTAEGMGCYFKLSGYGSGAELIITKG